MIVIKYDEKDKNNKCMHCIRSLMDFPYFHGYENALDSPTKIPNSAIILLGAVNGLMS